MPTNFTLGPENVWIGDPGEEYLVVQWKVDGDDSLYQRNLDMLQAGKRETERDINYGTELVAYATTQGEMFDELIDHFNNGPTPPHP